MELEQQYTINETHNLFLNKLIDNQQPKSVHLMKLDSHRTLYQNGIECKYETNLVVSGRNFIEIYAIFQNQITISMGSHHIFEDIRLVRQWEKNIVIQAGSNKIVGLIYEDSIIKNSFMVSLDFLDLGPDQKIDIICDRLGYYMLIVSARQLLLCVSQKTIQKYKAKPFYHRNSVIISEDIKWNRPEYQSIADVIRIQLYDFDISKVECFHFCDDKLYFIGHSSKTNNEKHLFYIACGIIFSQDENQPLLMNLTQQSPSTKEIYHIHRGQETQYLVVRNDGSLELQSQKGTIIIEKNKFQSSVKSSKPLLKCTPQSIFPFYIIQGRFVYIYRRDPSYEASSITTASQIYKNCFRLPETVLVNEFDIREYCFVYCNNHEVAVMNFQGFEEDANKAMKSKQRDSQQPYRNVLKRSFGAIVDFNLGRNFMIVENYFENRCRLNLLSKAIRQDPRSFVTHPKKNSLQSIPKTKRIRSLMEYIKIQDTETEKPEVKALLFRISELVVITNNERSMSLYRLDQRGQKQLLFSQFDFYTVIDLSCLEYNESRSWILVLWHRQQNKICYYDIGRLPISKVKQVNEANLPFEVEKNSHKIFTFNDLLIQATNRDPLELHCYSMKINAAFSIKLGEEPINHSCGIELIKKNITFKKKDKDFFILEALAISQKGELYIWEISVSTQLSKLTHKTQEVGQGLPILFYTPHSSLQFQNLVTSHSFRAITCPQYILQPQSTNTSMYLTPKVLKMNVYEHEGHSFLFLINSNSTLMLYKKYYCSSSNQSSLPIGTTPNLVNNHILHSDIGYLYHREQIELGILKRFQYNEKQAFVDLGQGILRVCNYGFYKNELFEIPEETVSCFRMDDEIWGLQSNGKIKMFITKGKVVSHFLVTEITTSINLQILGIQATNEIYAIYSPKGFEVLNKDPVVIWRSNPNQFGARQRIITLCAFEHYIAVSYYNYAVNEEDKSEFQSIKFKLRIYNTFLKNKIIEKQMPLQQPALFINYIAPDKLLIVTPSNVFVYAMKNDRTLETLRRKNYSKRNMLSSFSYIPEKNGIMPGYMIFGGNYGGLSFMVGQWIEKEKLDEIWFEGIKCSIKQLEIFHYGDKNDFLKSLLADDEGNIMVLDLTPKKSDKLADFHLGSKVTKIKKRNQIPYIASTDGCINLLIPIKLKNVEVSFLDFQDQISQQIPFLGGLNTRQSRCLQQKQRTYKITSMGNMVDSQIFKKFMSLSESLQNHIFDKIDMDMRDLKQQLLKQI